MTSFALTAERVQKRARELNAAQLLLLVVSGIFWAIGWLISKAWLVVWTGLSWALAAVEVGWKDARRRPGDGGS